MMTKKRITTEQAEALLERYYEGLTSVADERLLHVFLSQKNLPQRFEADQALLGYFAETKKKATLKTKIMPIIRWGSVAATLLLGLFLAKTFLNDKQVNYAYINGRRCTDINVVTKEALASLQVIQSAPNEVSVSVNHLNDDELVKQQLAMFTGNNRNK